MVGSDLAVAQNDEAKVEEEALEAGRTWFFRGRPGLRLTGDAVLEPASSAVAASVFFVVAVVPNTL